MGTLPLEARARIRTCTLSLSTCSLYSSRPAVHCKLYPCNKWLQFEAVAGRAVRCAVAPMQIKGRGEHA